MRLEAVAALKDGRIDVAGALGPRPDLTSFAASAEPLLELSPWAPTGSPYLEIAEAARRAVPDIAISEGTLRWTGFDLGPPSTPRPGSRWVGVGIAGALGGVLLLLGFAWVLRRRVRVVTAQLQSANASLEARVRLRTAELDLINASLSRFGRLIAHDLRNPITVVSGMAHLLRTHEIDADARVGILEAIERSALKLNEMISTMLIDAVGSGGNVVELDGGAYEGWLRGAVVAEVLDAKADLQVKAPLGNIDIDVSLLLKCSLNLVGNALKYAVNSEGMRIEVALVESGDHWILTVDDNGPGLPGASGFEAIFKRGFRGHDDDRGEGWGLADIRDLVGAAGGSVSASSSILGGAHFSAVLPRGSELPGELDDLEDLEDLGEAAMVGNGAVSVGGDTAVVSPGPGGAASAQQVEQVRWVAQHELTRFRSGPSVPAGESEPHSSGGSRRPVVHGVTEEDRMGDVELERDEERLEPLRSATEVIGEERDGG